MKEWVIAAGLMVPVPLNILPLTKMLKEKCIFLFLSFDFPEEGSFTITCK
jgi:hypothetical protein